MGNVPVFDGDLEFSGKDPCPGGQLVGQKNLVTAWPFAPVLLFKINRQQLAFAIPDDFDRRTRFDNLGVAG